MTRIRIENGRILDPHSSRDSCGEVCIDNGAILSTKNSTMDFTADIIINAKDSWVCPGIVDLSARICNPGETIKKTFTTEAAAAASAGVTSVCCPPDTHPIIDSSAAVEFLLKSASDSGQVRINPIGALTQGLKGDRLAEMFTLKTAGCVAVSNANQPLANYEILRRAMEYAASSDLTVFFHPEDFSLRNYGVVNEGALSTRLGLPPIPEIAETVAVSSALLIAELSGTKIHFCRISTARAVDMIRQAKQLGLPVTADVDICHLYLTELDVDGYNSSCHLIPPLRSLHDKGALIQGLAEGVIDAVCSDHRLLSIDSKIAPFSQTEPGASTIELLLPLMLDLASRGKLSLLDAVEKITTNPAQILNLPCGRIEPGYNADIIIINPDISWTAREQQLNSGSKCTPFEGWELQGKVSHTILDGELIFQDK
ncbi:MAG: dihydroorotase [Gammaproteobacteria bacterium]|jgi:dihydroorotase